MSKTSTEDMRCQATRESEQFSDATSDFKPDSIQFIRQVLNCEIRAIELLSKSLGSEVCEFANAMIACNGRIVVLGVGKSGIIGMKFAGILASIGCPAYFMHATEAVHGDIGSLKFGDVLIALSMSGETTETVDAAFAATKLGASLLVITGNPNSTLASFASCVLSIPVQSEADAFNIIPTASTTAMLALSDGIALLLSHRKKTSAEELSRFHPAGSIGRRLLMKVDVLMKCDEDIPRVSQYQSVEIAVRTMTAGKLGIVLVSTPENELLGIFTDGDLRRLVDADIKWLQKDIRDVMTPNPVTVEETISAISCLQIMTRRKISAMPVIDELKKIVGIIHLHQLIDAGIG